mmetsp:Transcript_19207/g.43409  ORF Transcript_19207/g.43409 Transcript_19207/m.43409 type:complete len:201 (-) Transcript_19207:231-833(-)
MRRARLYVLLMLLLLLLLLLLPPPLPRLLSLIPSSLCFRISVTFDAKVWVRLRPNSVRCVSTAARSACSNGSFASVVLRAVIFPYSVRISSSLKVPLMASYAVSKPSPAPKHCTRLRLRNKSREDMMLWWVVEFLTAPVVLGVVLGVLSIPAPVPFPFPAPAPAPVPAPTASASSSESIKSTTSVESTTSEFSVDWTYLR